MAKYYSWTRFTFGGPRPKDHIMPGDEISKSDFKDMDDDEFDELVAVGAIREQPYPIPRDEDFQGSPREYVLAKIAEMNKEQELSSVTDTWHVPHLQERAQEAKNAKDSGYEEPKTTKDKEPASGAGSGKLAGSNR